MKRAALLAAACLSLAACAPDATSPSTNAPVLTTSDKIMLVYTPVRLLASLCAAGVTEPCTDLNVRAVIKASLPVADAAVAEATKQMSADPSRGSIAQWSSYAVSAINVLASLLAANDVKS